jgi:hypothetical protein
LFIDTLLTILKAILELLDEDAPVILWCMDYNFFRQLTTNGDLATINRSEDGKTSTLIVGDLMVTPFSLLGTCWRS